MKKLLIGAVGGFVLLFVLVIVCIAGFMGGDAGSISSPMAVFADDEEAYSYQYIGSELGVPWDIVMLADGIHAYEAGESSLKGYNPMLTSLEFCILQEEKFVLEYVEGDEEDEEEEDKESREEEESGEESEEKQEEKNKDDEKSKDDKKNMIPVWVSAEVRVFTGCNEILGYLGKDKETAKLNYKDASGIVADMNTVAETKGIENEVRYEVVLLSNPDYGTVLKEFVGLSDEHINYVMQLYDASYLAGLYGYTCDISGIQLPEIVQGSVTRDDLARVAVSLLGHPYLMGGKSSEVGPPSGPLDCSGYVDWVYVQCFGVPVGNGGLPDGISISGTAIQWYASEAIEESELQVGDLGFVRDPATVKNGQVNHVGIYLGSSDGKEYWIHCGGSSYGTADSPKGRVGISLASGLNSYNPVDGSTFSPAMKGCKFKYFRRPRFEFMGE